MEIFFMVWGKYKYCTSTFPISTLTIMGHSMSDQQVFCNDLLRFALNLACLLTFNILTKMKIFNCVWEGRVS